MDVDEEIKEIWDEMGLNDEERANELLPLNEEKEKVKRDFIEETVQKCQTLSVEIEETKAQHKHMLQITGAPLTEIQYVEKNGLHGTLKERYDQVYEAFHEYEPKFIQRVDMFKKVTGKLQEMFDDLEIPESEREDYTEVGDKDLTDLRLQRLETKIDNLQVQINANNKYAEILSEQINQYCSMLAIPVNEEIQEIMETRPVRPSQLVRLNDEVDKLFNESNDNKEKIGELAIEITRLWDILKVPQEERNEFLQSHDGISYNEILACVDLINTLNARRNEQIPNLIKEIKKQIKDLCKTLRYTDEQQDEVFHRAIDHMHKLNEADEKVGTKLLQTPVKQPPPQQQQQQEEEAVQNEAQPAEIPNEEQQAQVEQNEVNNTNKEEEELKEIPSHENQSKGSESEQKPTNTEEEEKKEEVQEESKPNTSEPEQKPSNPEEEEKKEDSQEVSQTKASESEQKPTNTEEEEKKEENHEQTEEKQEGEQPQNPSNEEETKAEPEQQKEEQKPEDIEKVEESQKEEQKPEESQSLANEEESREDRQTSLRGASEIEEEPSFKGVTIITEPSSNIHEEEEVHEQQTSEEEPKKFADIEDLESDAPEQYAKDGKMGEWEQKAARLQPKPNTPTENAAIALFEALDAELAHLKKLHQQSIPIMELIKQRESILNENKELDNNPPEDLAPVRKTIKTGRSYSTALAATQKKRKKSPRRKSTISAALKKERPETANVQPSLETVAKNSQTGYQTDSLLQKKKTKLPHQIPTEVIRLQTPNPSDTLHAEKVKRRMKTVLPRVEKKLAMALFEFKKENNEDFTIDGKVYLNELKHIQLTPTDKRMARTSLSSNSSLAHKSSKKTKPSA